MNVAEVFEWLADATRVLWSIILVVALISAAVITSHLIPRKEY